MAHSILVIAYHLLRDGASYRELGGDYFDHLNADRLTRYHTSICRLRERTVLGDEAAQAPAAQPLPP